MTFSLFVDTEYQAIVPRFAGELHALLSLRGTAGLPDVPRSVVFAIDTSSSMQGYPLMQVCSSVLITLSRMAAHDRAAIVAFDGEVRVLHEMTTLERGYHALQQAVFDISSGAGTCISGALEAATSLLATERLDRHRLIVLLTDGEPSVGLRSTRELIALVRQRLHDTTLLTLGIGPNYDPHLCRALAVAGHGAHHFIAHGAESQRVLPAALDQVAQTVLSQPTLRVRAAPGVRIDAALHDAIHVVRNDDRTLTIRLPDLTADDEGCVVLGLFLDNTTSAHDGSTRALFEVEASGRDLIYGGASYVVRHEVRVRLSPTGLGTPSPIVRAHRLLLRCGAIREHARELLVRGSGAKAAERLDHAAQELADALEWLPPGTLADRLRDALDLLRSERNAWRAVSNELQARFAVRRSHAASLWSCPGVPLQRLHDDL